MGRLVDYLNPISRLGQKKYSTIFPVFLVSGSAVFLEFYAYVIRGDPEVIGLYAIFVFLALIIYFAFRDGIKGGFIATFITISYYVYIVYNRNYNGEQFITSIQTIIAFAILYLILAYVIGWLKECIDMLIDQEANEKRRLKAVIQQLPVGVIITDSKGRVEQANRQIELLFGKQIPHGFMMGNDTFASIMRHGKPVSPSESSIMKVLRGERNVVGKEFTVNRDDGKKVHIRVSASTIQNRAGRVIAAASIINDITPEKEMEERKDDFVNMASHELKTPITSMKLYIESLFKRVASYQDERALKTLTSIKFQTERLQELVSDLLDVSRLQTGKLMFHKEGFRIDELIVETIESLKSSTRQQEITFAGGTVNVFADKFRISQVLTNLITNAIKYSPQNSLIHVRTKRESGSIVVSVKDQGIGIAKGQQKKIFDRLYQVTDPNEKTFPGLGMGLYISKEIIKRHKGTIWVESEKGHGSTFFFSLPIGNLSLPARKKPI